MKAEMTPTTHVGFLGLGKMGRAIAERLTGGPFQLHVFDTVADAMAPFAEQGAVLHRSPRSVADAASVVFACLPGQSVSLAVAFGDEGVMHGSAIKVYAEMSTIGCEVIREIEAGLKERGIETLDSPVTGGPPVARAGGLTMLVSGPGAAVEAARPLLELMGRNVFILGDRPGMGQLMKVVNNIVMATNVVTTCEALAMGSKAGLDPAAMLRVLDAGTGQSFAAAEIVKRGVAGTFDYGAALSILDKDMALGLSEAAALGAVVPVIERAREQWHAAYEAGLGNLDFTAVLQFIEKRSGTLVRSA